MSTALHHKDPSVRVLLGATWPEFTGQRIEAIPAETITFWGTNWDDGCRRRYKAVDLSTLKTVSVHKDPNWMTGSESYRTPVAIPEGCVVVVLVDSRCKQHVEIYAHPSTIQPMLPAPADLTDDEKVVLYYTRCLKSTYAGIKNYRFEEGGRKRGLTLERWEAAKASLMGKGFLNKAGAITVEGRNASPESL
jgi:hypothetical protein